MGQAFSRRGGKPARRGASRQKVEREGDDSTAAGEDGGRRGRSGSASRKTKKMPCQPKRCSKNDHIGGDHGLVRPTQGRRYTCKLQGRGKKKQTRQKICGSYKKKTKRERETDRNFGNIKRKWVKGRAPRGKEGGVGGLAKKERNDEKQKQERTRRGEDC